VKQRFDVVIVGGGVAGLVFAALLATGRQAQAMRITVVDAEPRPVFRATDDVALRVSAIATGSTGLLDAIGAWSFVREARACAYEHMRVWDAHHVPDSPAALQFDAAEFGVQQLGFIVENVLLQHAVLEVLDNSGVQLRFSTPIRTLKSTGRQFTLGLDDAECLGADLVVGADGARSFVRNAAGIGTHEWPYEQTALVTHLQPEKPHRSTALQRFLASGPLGMLPLADGRISVVWSTDPGSAAGALGADDAALGRMLGKASDYVLGELVVAGPRGAFPLCARHAERYVLPGLALIGDAAHAIHPLAGQGANLGLQDAAELADVVTEAIADGLHPGDLPVLRRYERARKGANATMMHFMTGLNRLFTTDSRVVEELRTAGMWAFNRSGPIRERAVRVALGVG
jgi:2-octaprenylphenol hydroxylase